MFARLFDPLLTLVYPQSCHVCGGSVERAADGIACRACWRRTNVFSGAEILCRKCGAPHPLRTPQTQAGQTDLQTFCRRCDDHFYDRARAVGVYEVALAASVLHLKREPFVATVLRKASLARLQDADFQGATVIVPVPLSKKRLLERGFNQAAVLSRILARQTRVKVDEQSLVRTVHTPLHRAGMDAKARRGSVEKAFVVARPNLVAGETVLLVDDVFTSGATVSACAEALKDSGARRVDVFTLAKTL